MLMISLARALRLALLGALLTLTAACSSLHLTQDREDMLVRAGSREEMLRAAPFAHVFTAYALIADQTYANSVYRPPHRVDIGDKTYCFKVDPFADRCRDFSAYARGILSEWRIIYAKMGDDDFSCPAGRTDCDRTVHGLGVQIWMRKGQVCSEAVIAFRGTDGESSDDWLSNLRWLTRGAPLYDQYDQVQDYTPAFVRTILDEPCFVPGRTRITTVGHSLGGGLAQQAAYKDGRIRKVFAFDPSFVTGYYDLPEAERERNAKGLEIERAYEFGEILGLPRYLLRHVFPVSACDPQVRNIRFNTLQGSAVAQHNLNALTTGFLRWSYETPPAVRRTDLPTPWPTDCAAQKALAGPAL